MGIILLIKKMITDFIKFMYLNEEEQIDADMGSEISVVGVITSTMEIVVCAVVCFLVFVIPVCIYMA